MKWLTQQDFNLITIKSEYSTYIIISLACTSFQWNLALTIIPIITLLAIIQENKSWQSFVTYIATTMLTLQYKYFIHLKHKQEQSNLSDQILEAAPRNSTIHWVFDLV